MIISAYWSLRKLFTFASLTKESPASLSLFVNTFRENVSTIGVGDLSGFILFYIGSRVVDPMTRRLFEATVEISDLNSLLEFVSQRFNVLENVGSSFSISCVENNEKTLGKRMTKNIQDKKFEKTSLAAVTSANTKKCLFCDTHMQFTSVLDSENHQFPNRREFVNKNQLCFVCLNSGYTINACPTAFTCRMCLSKHSTLLH